MDNNFTIDPEAYANRMMEGMQEQLSVAVQRAARFAALSDQLIVRIRELESGTDSADSEE